MVYIASVLFLSVVALPYGSLNEYHVQDISQDAREVYYNDGGVGLFPPLQNLARHADVSTNATCGEERNEVFCRRPADKEARRANQCKLIVCDARKNGPRRIVDGSKEAWISPTLENGLEYQYVTITLDLKQVYQITYITMKAGVAPRPAAMILERSIDGENFLPWQFYASSDADCQARYGLPASPRKPALESDDQVTCTAEYSKPFPLENGEIHTNLVSGRPGLDTSDEILRNFTRARFIRFRLQKMHKSERDMQLKKRLFYAIRGIAIGGQCICNGHAGKCSHNKEGIPSCECEHGTCGDNCETCCPLFHQHSWTPGTAESAGACQTCQCYGHASECRYNAVVAAAKLSLDTKGHYRGGGECINCTHHTTGVNCERCEKGWYRPLGIRPDDAEPCVACNCHPRGSIGSCAYDDSKPEKRAGFCECRPGFAGANCDKCAPGHRHFPTCEPCPCDLRGSKPGQDCSKDCECKLNVMGKECDECKPGFFALHEENPNGCIECYCSGLSTKCEAAEFDSFNSTTYSLENWMVTDLNGEGEVQPTADPETGLLYIGHYEVPPVDTYFWSAPQEFSGNLISAYGEMALIAQVGWEAMRGDTSGQPAHGPNIVLVGKNGIRLGLGDEIFEGRKGEVNLGAPLRESLWYLIPSEINDISDENDWNFHGPPASRLGFLSVLSDVKNILVRARFHTDQAEGSLLSVRLEKDISLEESSLFHLTERCVCPPGYSGLSCESCAFGYYREINASSETGPQCVACPCNGHAECDPDTTSCQECLHNTEDEDCGSCIKGFYGNARIGSKDDCKPCACPMTSPGNNFSPECEAIDEDSYICTDCTEGYNGTHCEKCAEGYFGEPLKEDGNCRPCECKGGPCDSISGQCLECKGNTDGPRCEKCKPFHFGDPLVSNCRPCDCNESGAGSLECDGLTGKCNCRFGYAGRRCGTCDVGFGNFSAGCPPCDCGLAAISGVCNAVTGECTCQTGVKTVRCDECLPLHFGLNTTGCSSCACHATGSETATCDIVSGQCSCLENVTGRACDKCEPNHWDIASGKGCRPCGCDSMGSTGFGCDSATGQCDCHPGVGGVHCNSCLIGHFGFSEGGCKPCDTCDKKGHVCHPETGHCVCPLLTEGLECESCATNSWGFRPKLGCRACGCDSGGAVRGQCDFATGVCECRPGFAGLNCSNCADGYYGFPMCRPCHCDLAGSLSRNCSEAGQCSCKPNVQGPKCDACRSGTFGLEQDNPNGCTACFCFGRSASCTQAGLRWSQIRSTRPRSVSIEYDPSPPFQNTLPIDTQEICYINLAVPGGGEVTLNGVDRGLNVTNNLRTIPGDTEDVKIGVSFLFDTPVYWQLPQQFLGDKVLSYGGFLKFDVETEGGHTHLPPGVLSTYPLIQIQGNNKLVLEYFPIIPSRDGHYDVRFHESLWYEKNPKRVATREALMVALQNLQHILIRASDAVDFTRVILKDVSMDTAAVALDSGVALAGGVERCECPPQYNSTSCQNPSIGFFRWFNRTYSTATILISLVGEAKPCECNGRSKICDVETGFCKQCSNHAGGSQCERCADGYYGDPSVGGCWPCPCPLPDRNFASGCQVVPGRDIVCFCKEGYTGKRCGRCGYGWYGLPEEPGGFCQPCQCNPYGSVSDECHEQTGQCNCRPGILGQDCSICPNHTVLTDKGCSTCEDGCTGILLSEVKHMSGELSSKSTLATDRSEIPWWRMQDFVSGPLTSTERLLQEWEKSSQEINHILLDNSHVHLKNSAKHVLEKASRLSNDSAEIATVASIFNSQANVMIAELKEVRDNVNTVLNTLDQYSGDNRVVSDSAALMEARRLLEKISSRYLQPKREQAERTLSFCNSILLKTQYMRGDYPELQDLIERMAKFAKKVDELQVLIQTTLVESEKRSIQSGEIKRKLGMVKEKLERISSGLAEVDDLYNGSDSLLDKAEEALAEADRNYKNLTNVQLSLKNSSLILERQEGILYGLNPLYHSKYVKPAQEHADALRRLAQDYQKYFNSSIGDASQAVGASRAYQEIVATVENVREAAEGATVSADIALKEVFPLTNEDSVIERAQNSKAVSSRLHSTAKTPLTGGQDLRALLRKQQENVLDLEETVRNAADKNNIITTELQKLEDLQIGNHLQTSIALAESIKNQMDLTKETAQKVSEDITTKLRPQLIELFNETKQFDLEKANNNIDEGLKSNQRANERLGQLTTDKDFREQQQNFKLANDSLSSALINLRNKITEARHASHGVRLSLTSNSSRGCVRSYKVPGLEPTIANRIVVTLSLNPQERDGLIVYLPSATTSDYLAIELVNKQVRFVWDLGGGPAYVSKTLDSPKPLKNGSKWFKIIAERKSYSGRLWVLPGGFPETQIPPAVNESAFEYGWLDLSPSDRLWIGGLPPGQEAPAGILSSHTGLIGCLHSVVLDETPIGLWNFDSDLTNSCAACVKGIEETVEESSYRFNGEGYSVLQHVSKGTYNKYQFSVALKFKTYDDNAVLFVAVTNHKDRYVSILLRDGHVVFQIGYGGESQLEMSSSRRYNDGNWTSVEASRNFDRRRGVEKGLLKVGDESKDAAPPTPTLQTQIPDLSGADYLIGGVPQGYNFGKLHLRLPKPLLGCLSDLFIDKDLYNPIMGRSNGVTSSCVERKIKMAGFHGNGYLHLEASSLKRLATFSLVLRTLQADAVILLAIDKFNQLLENDVIDEETQTESANRSHGYYSVALVDGRVEVRLEAGKGAITLVSQALVNDGRFHAIAVTKTNRKVELRIDDVLQATSSMPDGAKVVRVKDLFIGGVPRNLDATLYASDITPFTGTIKDILFDFNLRNLENPIAFFGVELGRLGPERDDSTLVPSLMRTSTPNPGCRRSRKYVVDPRAVKFGDSPNSHVQLRLRRRNLFSKNFTLEMDFRTFYADGLLFLIPISHKDEDKQKHFILGGIRNGQVHVIRKGKKRWYLTAAQKINDGSWHHLELKKEGRNLSLSVDLSQPATINLPKKINTGNIVYIGGIPEKDPLLPDSLLSRIEGFRGCVTNLRISNQTEDLIGDKSQHQRVGQCFPHVEQGSYFSGDAYVIHRKDFLVKDFLKLELDFRTSELNGILLSIADPLGYPAFALEFAAGKMIFSGDTGDRRIFHLPYEFPSLYAICDNKWHHVTVLYEAEEVVMQVDDQATRMPLLRNNYFLESYLNASLYIGGLSDHVPNERRLLETSDNFKGCMRNLTVGGERWDWTEMHSLHNVLIGSCPAVTHH